MVTPSAIGIELSVTDSSIILTKELIDQYLVELQANGGKKETVRAYARSLEKLYAFLPEDKEITQDSLRSWKESLIEDGCSDSTVNLRLSSVNSLMKYCGFRKSYLSHTPVARNAKLPEMTRDEYLKFLGFIRENGTEQEYLLVKVFALLDLHLRDLSQVTVEACREGVISCGENKSMKIPACLQKELLSFTERHQLTSGPVFVTKGGHLLDRSNITHAFHQLAKGSGISPEKCNPSALHRLYVRTQDEITKQLEHLHTHAYDSLLDAEQVLIAWRV